VHLDIIKVIHSPTNTQVSVLKTLLTIYWAEEYILQRKMQKVY